ncbi:GntR family transcriptional regulator [Vogesella sp. DC21W]|uniref:GntR family transcriptional regulator n=1 Tax=Vogesella aquatica TaxID=2984206 RepID=A0ABT5J1S5_9NEIS|nr:GntR family transcriptional regulator [Vogesella aquatica]MDC7718607.1 GntR family transcriptional regulator [Vogesella aquatica]
MKADTLPPLHASQPLHSQIREHLRAAILDGRYHEHDKLPSEQQLMTQFGVSRITVRHALAALQQEGLLFKVAGKGCFVSRPAAKPVQTLARLQGFAEAMSQRGHTACNRVLRLAPCPADTAIATALGVDAGSEVMEIRRLRYLDQQPVSLDISYFPLALGQRLAREDLAGRDIFLILENDYATPLGHADLTIHACVADTDTAGQLGCRSGDALLHVERVTRAADGQPLVLDYLYYRADRFSYQLRINRS